MRIQGHIAEGLLAGAATVLLVQPEPAIADSVVVISGIAGGLPDLDALFYFAGRRTFRIGTDFRHHTWVTHTFPFYLIPALAAYLGGEFMGNWHLQLYSLVFALATTLHLLQDMHGSGDGIMLWYPFNRRMVGWQLTGTHGPEWLADYLKGPVYKVELVANSLALTWVAWYVASRLAG